MSSLKQTLDLRQLQKLSPQQIQFIKLLQLNTMDLEQRVEEELLDNPAIETGADDDPIEQDKEVGEDEIKSIEDDLKLNTDEPAPTSEDSETAETEDWNEDDLYDVSDYTNDDNDDDGFHLYEEGNNNDDEERKEMPIATGTTFHESLIEQFDAIAQNEFEEKLGLQLIGSIDDDGYLRRSLDAISNDLAFSQNVEAPVAELEKMLKKIQALDPPGIGARDLQECLLLQLARKDQSLLAVKQAIEVIKFYMDDFIKKHYEKLCKHLKIGEAELKGIISIITKLNPRPGETETSSKSQYIIPDFILTNNLGKVEVTLNSRNAPDLRISRSYMDTLKSYEKNPTGNKHIKDTVQFIKQKLDSAKWFIDSIKQRQQTLLLTMNAIARYQTEFFIEGDETKLRPMILKDIADRIKMDISTVSRVANSKYVETEFGIFALKYFFSEGVTNDEGEEVSNKEIKKILSDCIGAEDKSKPLPDEKLMDILKEKGYPIARRTVAKYREQLGIPVARLRKEL
jgi:RNA polymerase sigma-54 factor